jgi:hypothetical protein
LFEARGTRALSNVLRGSCELTKFGAGAGTSQSTVSQISVFRPEKSSSLLMAAFGMAAKSATECQRAMSPSGQKKLPAM